MSRKFNVGDRVRIVATVMKEARHLIGSVATIISYDRADNTYELDIRDTRRGSAYKHVWAEPQNIVPIYDGNDLVSWSTCVWQPKSLVRS